MTRWLLIYQDIIDERNSGRSRFWGESVPEVGHQHVWRIHGVDGSMVRLDPLTLCANPIRLSGKYRFQCFVAF